MEIKLDKTTYDHLHGLTLWVKATPKELILSDSVWDSIYEMQLDMISGANLDMVRYTVMHTFIKDEQLWVAVQDDDTDTEENILIVMA